MKALCVLRPVHYYGYIRAIVEAKRVLKNTTKNTHTKKITQSPGEFKRREVVLDPHVSPEEIKSWEMELGSKVDFLCFSCFSTAALRTLSL